MVRSLLKAGLVDELRLIVFPVVLRRGEKLFGDGAEAQALKLLGTRTLGDGLVFIDYEIGD